MYGYKYLSFDTQQQSNITNKWNVGSYVIMVLAKQVTV